MKKYKKTSKLISTLFIAGTLFSLMGCDLDKSVRELGNQKTEGIKHGSSISDEAEDNRPRPADEFIVTTLTQIPNYKIRHSQGYYCRMFAFDGYNYSSHFNQVIGEIIQEGKKNGAHALLNMSTTAIPFNQIIKDENIKNSPANSTPASTSDKFTQFTNSQSIVQVCGDMVEIQSAETEQ